MKPWCTTSCGAKVSSHQKVEIPLPTFTSKFYDKYWIKNVQTNERTMNTSYFKPNPFKIILFTQIHRAGNYMRLVDPAIVSRHIIEPNDSRKNSNIFPTHFRWWNFDFFWYVSHSVRISQTLECFKKLMLINWINHDIWITECVLLNFERKRKKYLPDGWRILWTIWGDSDD